jgi:hypothetical protein
VKPFKSPERPKLLDGLEAHERAPREIVLDLDNTDIPLHGEQEGRLTATCIWSRPPEIRQSVAFQTIIVILNALIYLH